MYKLFLTITLCVLFIVTVSEARRRRTRPRKNPKVMMERYFTRRFSTFLERNDMNELVSEPCYQAWKNFSDTMARRDNNGEKVKNLLDRNIKLESCFQNNYGQYCRVITNSTMKLGSKTRDFSYSFAWCYPSKCSIDELNVGLEKFADDLTLPMTIKMKVPECVSSLEDARKTGFNVDIVRENLNLMNQTLFEVGRETNSTDLVAGVMSYIDSVQRRAKGQKAKDDDGNDGDKKEPKQSDQQGSTDEDSESDESTRDEDDE